MDDQRQSVAVVSTEEGGELEEEGGTQGVGGAWRAWEEGGEVRRGEVVGAVGEWVKRRKKERYNRVRKMRRGEEGRLGVRED